MLNFTVNDKLPGDTVFLGSGSAVQIKAAAFGHATQVPLDRLELIVHGEIISTVSIKEPEQSAALLVLGQQLKIDKGCWVALRCYAGNGQVAHTTPVYVSVNGSGFHNKTTIKKYLRLAEQYLRELEMDLKKINDNPEYQGWRYRKGIKKRISDTRSIIKQLENKEDL